MHLFVRLAFGVLCAGAGFVEIDVAASQPQATKGIAQNACSLDWLLDGRSPDTPPTGRVNLIAGPLGLQELEGYRARWRSSRLTYYRLCVATFNPLLATVTESDVRDGAVLVARHAAAIPGLYPDRDPGEWAPSEGSTVEALFTKIEDALRGPDVGARSFDIRYKVSASFDPSLGYPTSISLYPADAGIIDAEVSMRITLTDAPRVPLTAPSAGQAYPSPRRARVVRTVVGYDTLFGFGSEGAATNVRRVWPQRADEIVARGSSRYWDTVGWKPRPGMVGNVIGAFKHPDGQSLYLLELDHLGTTIFYPIATGGVEFIK